MEHTFLIAWSLKRTYTHCCWYVQMFESQLLAVQDKLSSVFVEKFEQLQCALDALTDRLSIVERDFAVERDRQTKDWEEKNATISRDISVIQVSGRQRAQTMRHHIHADGKRSNM